MKPDCSSEHSHASVTLLQSTEAEEILTSHTEGNVDANMLACCPVRALIGSMVPFDHPASSGSETSGNGDKVRSDLDLLQHTGLLAVAQHNV